MKNQLRTVAYRSYQLARISRFLSKDSLLKIFKVYILPIYDYGDILYMRASVTTFQKLQISQNRVLKICLKQQRLTPTCNVHNDAGINLLKDRREFHAHVEGYKRSKKDKFLKSVTVRTRLNNGPVLHNFLPHCESYKKSVEYNISVLWNLLHSDVRNLPCMLVFKSRLKENLKVLIPQKCAY